MLLTIYLFFIFFFVTGPNYTIRFICIYNKRELYHKHLCIIEYGSAYISLFLYIIFHQQILSARYWWVYHGIWLLASMIDYASTCTKSIEGNDQISGTYMKYLNCYRKLPVKNNWGYIVQGYGTLTVRIKQIFQISNINSEYQHGQV